MADGLGHLIRTRAVVEACPGRLDAHVIAIGDRHAGALLADLAVPYAVVEDEAEAVVAARKWEFEVVVLDLTSLGKAAWEGLAPGRLNVSLSPVFDRLGDVDLAFNRTRYTQPEPQPRPEARRYGLEYAVVRPECRRIDTGTYARHLDEDVLSVAVSMGGIDAANRTRRVLQRLRELERPVELWVLLGEGYSHSYEDLVDAVQRDRRHEVILAKTNRSMWRILGNCSLAILAGGVTTYEAAFAGLPSINVLDVPEHGFLTRELLEHGVAIDVGTVDQGTLAETVGALERDRERLFRAHRASRGLLDGRGAIRVAEAIAMAATRRREAFTASR